MVRLPPHARGRDPALESTREPPESLSTVETWRWSLETVLASPPLLGTVCVAGIGVGLLATISSLPGILLALLAGYVLQTTMAAAVVATREDGDRNEDLPGPRHVDVLRLGVDRVDAVALTALILAVCLTVVLEAVVHVLAAVVHPVVFVQAAALATLTAFVHVAFAGPAAVLDRQSPVQAIVDGGLRTGVARTELLALHLTFLAFAAPGVMAVLAAQSTVAVAVGAATVCVWTGLLAVSFARTYVVAIDRQEVTQRDRTPAWKLEGAPAGRK